MWLESIRPRPSPLPAGLVVTKGSNMRCRTSDAIAGPLLLMAMRQRAVCPLFPGRPDQDRLLLDALHGVQRIRHDVAQQLLKSRLIGNDAEIGVNVRHDGRRRPP